MAKRLSARIAERTGRKTPSRHGKNRAAFLAVRDDVKEAIDDGWPIKEIWETLYEEGKVSFSYETFRTYVNRLIVGRQLEIGRGSLAGKKERRNGKPDLAGVQSVDKKSTAGIRVFTFNSTPKKEDLF
jgi:hypothetical protein